MASCSYCGAQEPLPFKCKFCGDYFCSEHRLPEKHECIGLIKFKEERGKEPEKWIYEPFHAKHKEERAGREVRKPLLERLMDYFKEDTQKKILYVILALIILALVANALR